MKPKEEVAISTETREAFEKMGDMVKAGELTITAGDVTVSAETLAERESETRVDPSEEFEPEVLRGAE